VFYCRQNTGAYDKHICLRWAALGTHHYKVYKQDVAEETVTAIKSLDHKEKVLEIAGMLSGAAIDAAAIANAESLIRK